MNLETLSVRERGNGKEINNDRSVLSKKALYLSYFSLGYNFLEGIVSVLVGQITGSIALLGFGLDSFAESLSGGVMIWRFRRHAELSQEEEERVEAKATRIVAYTFFVLAAYVLFESLRTIYYREIPEPSLVGIIIAIVSIIVMPTLFLLKYKIGKSIASSSLVADSKQTLACVFLSFALLIGLGLNYSYGIWWADPVVGLLIVAYLIREGYNTLTEEKLCSC